MEDALVREEEIYNGLEGLDAKYHLRKVTLS